MARRTDEFNKDVIELRMELAKMRATVTALEERVAVLERDLAAARGGKTPAPPLSSPSGIPRPGAPTIKKPTKSAGPPPLPGMPPNMPALPKSAATSSKHPGKRSYVDISEIAELVDSVPPPPTRGTRR